MDLNLAGRRAQAILLLRSLKTVRFPANFPNKNIRVDVDGVANVAVSVCTRISFGRGKVTCTQ